MLIRSITQQNMLRYFTAHFGTLAELLAYEAPHALLEIAFGFGVVETFRVAGRFRTSAVPPYPKQSTQP